MTNVLSIFHRGIYWQPGTDEGKDCHSSLSKFPN